MPEGEKACGFTCGARELYGWPKHELFQFQRDTDAYYGELAPLLPPISQQDIAEGVHVGAANLYHAAAHGYISGSGAGRAGQRKALCKSAFFLMQMVHYLRSGVYIKTKRDLMKELTDDEQMLLRPGADDALFGYILDWCSGIVARK